MKLKSPIPGTRRTTGSAAVSYASGVTSGAGAPGSFGLKPGWRWLFQVSPLSIEKLAPTNGSPTMSGLSTAR